MLAAVGRPGRIGLPDTAEIRRSTRRLNTAPQLRILARPRNPAGIRGPVHLGPDSSWPSSMTTTGKDIVMAMDWHDTLMGSVLVISAGLTFAYTRAASRILLILTLTGAAATFVIGVLLFFHLA